MSNQSPHLPAYQAHASPSPHAGQQQTQSLPDAAQLLQLLQSQQVQIQQMQQHMLQQAAAPVAVAAHAAAPPRQERPRIPPPPFFDGKGTGLDEWETALRKQITWYRTPVAEEVQLATMFLSGAAEDWWKHLQVNTKAAIGDFSSLVDAIRTRFQPVTTADLARVKITKLVQGKAPINDYVAAFRKLLTPLGDMHESDRLFHFLRGVKPEIATQIRMQGIKVLDTAIEMASRMGTMGEYGAQAAAPPSASHGSSAPMDLDALSLDNIEGLEKSETNGSSSSSSAAVPAGQLLAQLQEVLAAMRDTRRPRPPKVGQSKKFEDGRFRHGDLSRAEMDAHFSAGTCFECGKPGHRARNCPKAKPKDRPSN